MARERSEPKHKGSRWRVNEALDRAKTRWTPWRFVLIPVGFGFIVGTGFFIHYLNGQIYSMLAPDKVTFCGPNRISGLVLVMTDILLSIPVGFLLANLFVWLIPPARRALNAAEARVGRNFVQSNSELLKLLGIMAVILLPIHSLALASKVCVSDSQVFYQKHLFSGIKKYDRSEFKAIRKTCTRSSRGGWNIEFYLIMKDGNAIFVSEGSLPSHALLVGIPMYESACTHT